MARPFRGTGFASHTKTLMERASSRNQLSPLPEIGEGVGEWSEALSYGKRGSGELRSAGQRPASSKNKLCLHKKEYKI